MRTYPLIFEQLTPPLYNLVQNNLVQVQVLYTQSHRTQDTVYLAQQIVFYSLLHQSIETLTMYKSSLVATKCLGSSADAGSIYALGTLTHFQISFLHWDSFWIFSQYLCSTQLYVQLVFSTVVFFSSCSIIQKEYYGITYRYLFMTSRGKLFLPKYFTTLIHLTMDEIYHINIGRYYVLEKVKLSISCTNIQYFMEFYRVHLICQKCSLKRIFHVTLAQQTFLSFNELQCENSEKFLELPENFLNFKKVDLTYCIRQ